MPEPGSHAFDVERTRRRGELERDAAPSVPDQHADEAARQELERDNPPRLVPGPRAPGPAGSGSGVGGPAAGNEMNLRSAAFSANDLIPDRYSKDGGDVSPPLTWDPAPAGTAELVLLCEDPDAPGGTFVHWVITGLDASETDLAEGEIPPDATLGRNGYGDSGWGGPQPPVGETHRYVFTLIAVDEPLQVGPDAGPEDVRAAASGHELATSTLVGRFGR
jgi:Raf kinase inhibitor-like YbhB/YbcL family protein